MNEYHREHNSDSEDRPIVTDLSWGETTVLFKGVQTVYKDAIVWPDGHCEWDWNVYGTRHKPGIQIGDVKDLVENHNCNHIILSTGMHDVLKIDPKTIRWLKDNNIDYEIHNSIKAVKYYNERFNEPDEPEAYRDPIRFALLLHSTC